MIYNSILRSYLQPRKNKILAYSNRNHSWMDFYNIVQVVTEMLEQTSVAYSTNKTMKKVLYKT